MEIFLYIIYKKMGKNVKTGRRRQQDCRRLCKTEFYWRLAEGGSSRLVGKVVIVPELAKAVFKGALTGI